MFLLEVHISSIWAARLKPEINRYLYEHHREFSEEEECTYAD